IETSADMNMEEVDEDMIVEDADEYSAQPWMKPHNLLQDKLVVVHVFTINAKTYCPQEDFWKLGLRREMESDIGNACMKLIYEDARVHGKYIYTADMYVVTTWKDSVDPLTYFPDDADMKDALVFPLWTKAASPEHYLLCVFPQQTNSIDCGVFIMPFTLCCYKVYCWSLNSNNTN
uniref:Uncharacterized protein n=1 Tax=Cyprinus carpio carpio TaxID=630221 RepID=A0A9J8BPT9_CYPCA